MSARVTVQVKMPDGSAAAGSELAATNLYATDPRNREWKGSTGSDGRFTWARMDTGVLQSDMYRIKATYIDAEGVRWTGEVTDRIRRDVVVNICVNPSYLGKLSIPDVVLSNIEKLPEGRTLIEGIRELEEALRGGMAQSVVVLCHWALEGLVILKARTKDLWKDDWDTKSLGYFLDQPEVQQIVPDELRRKARTVAAVRHPGAHFMGKKTSPEEAQIAASIVRDVATALYARV